MATPVIKHATLTGAAANPAVLVDGPKWDATHIVTGLENVPNVDTTNADNITGGSQTGTGALVRASAISASGKPFFIFATGQSFLTQTPALTWTPESNVKVWNWDGVDTHVGTAFAAPSATTINLVTKMASDIARANPTRTVYLFNISYAGLAISHWLSGTGAPDMLLNIQNNITAALTAAACTQADLGLWAQGPADTLPINASYVANHATWMGRLWADTTPGYIWFPRETPLIVCSIQATADSNSLNADADNFNVLLNAVANADPDKRRFAYLSSFTGSTYWDLTAHPTAQGHLSIGAMLASEYLNGTGRNTLPTVTVNPANGNICIGNPAYSVVPYLLNYNTSVAPTAPVSGSRRHIIGPDAGNVFDTADTYGSASFSNLIGYHAGGTQAAPTKTTSGSILHGIAGQGRDASPADVRTNKVSIQLVAREDWNDATHHGTGIDVFLTQLATNTTGTAFSIDPGFLTIYGTTSGSWKFQPPAVAGTVTVTSGQFPGSTTNDNATAGNFGEYLDTGSSNNNASATVTMTIASPCVVTWTAHGFTVGNATTAVKFTTTGALPTGITSGTTYYIKAIDANTFNVATSVDNAFAGTFVNTSGSQSGVQTGDIRIVMSSGARQDVAGIRLAAGDYEVGGQMLKGAGTTTTVTYIGGNITTSSAGLDRTFGRRLTFEYGGSVLNATEFTVFDFASTRFSLASTTTIYLVADDNFGTSTMSCSGWLRSRRAR